MKIGSIQSHSELVDRIKNQEKSYLLLYKEGTEQSDCALEMLKDIELEEGNIEVLSADVNMVRDIHSKYDIKSVPSLMEFDSGNYKNVLKGCQTTDFYKAYFENVIYELKASESDKPVKSVTVYTTPTCPWCTTVKNFLKKNGVRYSEVDVAADQNAAKDMVSKSGQQGVPQTEINGEMVIGFDQTKLNRLLDLK